jgi:hypothetical protein
MFLEPLASFSFIRPSTAGRTSEDTSLSLVCELNFGSGTLTDSTQVSPSRASSPVRFTFSFFAMPEACVAVDRPRQRAAEARQMGAAIALRDVVGEGQHHFVVAVVPPHGDLDPMPSLLPVTIDRLADQRCLRPVEIADEFPHPALIASSTGSGSRRRVRRSA